MLHSTKGIVFHSLKYAETSVIVKIYTELFGIRSYLFKGIRSARSKIKPGLFQPLTLLDLVVYHKERQSLQAAREVHLAHPFRTIPFDIRKSAVAMFINELVYKAIREEEPNPELFSFLWQTCLQLDEPDVSVPDFHLRFAISLCRYLGIMPQNNYSEACRIFNLMEGFFQDSVPNHPQYLDPVKSRMMSELLSSPVPPAASCIPQAERMQLLESILLYYQLHLPGFREVRSHHILHDVLA